jgi:hypothetical protein
MDNETRCKDEGFLYHTWIIDKWLVRLQQQFTGAGLGGDHLIGQRHTQSSATTL